MNPDDPKLLALLKSLGLDMTPVPVQAPTPHERVWDIAEHDRAWNAKKAMYEREYAAATPARFDSLVASPYVDTLRAIAGSPNGMIYQKDFPDEHRGGVAQYRGQVEPDGRPQSDTIAVNQAGLAMGSVMPDDTTIGIASPSAARDWMMAHEFGHRYESQAFVHEPLEYIHDFGARDAGASATSAPASLVGFTRVAEEGPMRPTKDQYAATNVQEHFADAFANAIDFYRATSKLGPGPQLPRQASDLAREYERRVPGTASIVKALYNHPIYAKHPLRLSTNLAVVPDVTAVSH